MSWNALDTYVFSGVANGAIPAPTSYASPSTGQAWTDVYGGIWTVSSGLLQGTCDAVNGSQFARDFLLAGSNTDEINQRIVTYIPANGFGNLYNVHRYQRTGNVGNSYIVSVNGQYHSVNIYSLQGSGNATATQIGTSTNFTFNAAHAYTLDTSVIGTNPTTIAFTFTDVTASTTYTGSFTDSTSNLQQIGAMAVDVANKTGAATAAASQISQINTYAYSAAASAITVTGPTSGPAGVVSSGFTASVNGSLASNVVLTPSDNGAGGTFTPSTVTFASGSTPANQTFTYTPAASGTVTISFTNNGSLTNPSNITYVVANGVSLPQANILFPAQGWDLSTSGHAITNASGNYLKANFTTSATANLSLLINYATFGSTADAEKPVLTWSIGSGAPQQLALTAANVTNGLVPLATALTAGTYTLQIWVRGSSPFINHWNPAADRNFIDIVGFTVSSGTIAFNAIANQLSGMLLGFGDSMTEGEGTEGFVSNGSHASYATNDDATHSYLPHLATALNCEYASAAFGGQGWVSTAADGVTPNLPGSWNYQYSGKARSFSGLTYVTANMGTNGNTAGSAGTVAAFLTSLRAACGRHDQDRRLYPVERMRPSRIGG